MRSGCGPRAGLAPVPPLVGALPGPLPLPWSRPLRGSVTALRLRARKERVGVIRRSTILLSHGLSCRLRSRRRMPGACYRWGPQQAGRSTGGLLGTIHAEPREASPRTLTPVRWGRICLPWGLTSTADPSKEMLPRAKSCTAGGPPLPFSLSEKGCLLPSHCRALLLLLSRGLAWGGMTPWTGDSEGPCVPN